MADEKDVDDLVSCDDIDVLKDRIKCEEKNWKIQKWWKRVTIILWFDETSEGQTTCAVNTIPP